MIRFSATELEIESLLSFLARRTRNLHLPAVDAAGNAVPLREGTGAPSVSSAEDLTRDAVGRPQQKRRALSGFYMTPLVSEERADLRFRRTPRPFLNALRTESGPLVWGLRLALDSDAPMVIKRDTSENRLFIEPEDSRLIVLALGPPQQDDERRRDGVIEVRDWVAHEEVPEDEPKPKGVLLLPQTYVARNLVERAARRLRRRGHLLNGRWHVPPLPPEDEDDEED